MAIALVAAGAAAVASNWGPLQPRSGATVATIIAVVAGLYIAYDVMTD